MRNQQSLLFEFQIKICLGGNELSIWEKLQVEISRLEENRCEDMPKIGYFQRHVDLEVTLKHTSRRFRILANKGKGKGNFQKPDQIDDQRHVTGNRQKGTKLFPNPTKL